MLPIAKQFSEIWLPNGASLSFDPKLVAESTHIMSDEQYYALKEIAGSSRKAFDALAVEYLDMAKQQQLARQAELDSINRENTRALIREVLNEKNDKEA